MDAADENVNIIALWMGRRMGKTEAICANIFGRTITDEPGNIYSMWPIEKSAEKFSRDTINPMIEATPSLRTRTFEAKSRDAGRTKFYIRFAGGSLYIVFSGSQSATRGMAAKVIALHEVDDPAYLESAGGDILEKALGRAEGFGDAIKIIESTGTFTSTTDETGAIKYRSKIAYWYDRGDKRKWFCPCRRCGQRQWLKFKQIRFAGEMAEAEYFCERCDAEHNEAQWRRMVREGRWFATAGLSDAQLLNIEANHQAARAKDPVVRSYWINGFNSLLPKGKGFKTKLHQFVSEAARAKEKPATEQVWVNEVAAELYNPDQLLEPSPDWKPLFDRREAYGTEEGIVVPEGISVITAGGDVHDNRIEISFLGWGRRERCAVLDHVVLDGDTHKLEVWERCTREVQRRFKHASGAEIGVDFGLFDAGHIAEDLMRWLKTFPLPGKIRACRGASKYPHPLIDNRWKTLAGNLKGHWIGTHVAKDIIYSRLRLVLLEEKEGHTEAKYPHGWIHFCQRLPEIYFEQLTAEKVTVDDGKRTYECPPSVRNETLDCFVYGLAAFKRRIWNFDLIEAHLAKQAAEAANDEPPKKEQTEQPMQPKRSPFGGRGWTL